MDNGDWLYIRGDSDSWSASRAENVSWTRLVGMDEIHVDHSRGDVAADDVACVECDEVEGGCCRMGYERTADHNNS